MIYRITTIKQLFQRRQWGGQSLQALHYWLFVRGIHRSPVDPSHKGSVRQKAIPCHNEVLTDKARAAVVDTAVAAAPSSVSDEVSVRSISSAMVTLLWKLARCLSYRLFFFDWKRTWMRILAPLILWLSNENWESDLGTLLLTCHFLYEEVRNY